MRKFYTCPVEAIYMAKNFGCEFLLEGAYSSPVYKKDDAVILIEGHEEGDKYYIHPGSLSILDPKEGDTVINKNGTSKRIVGGTNCDNNYYIHIDKTKKLDLKIIQRDGKAFIRPKEEL